MMPSYVEMPIDDQTTMLVEVTRQSEGVVSAGVGREVIGRVSETFEEVLGRLARMGTAVSAQMEAAIQPVDRVVVQLGLKVSAKTGFVIAESAGEAQLTISFEWQRSAADEPPPQA
jgi:hypothetical protein